MSGSVSYQTPNFLIPYSVPASVPALLVPVIRPIYIAFQNIINTLITFAGIAPRAPSEILLSLNDPTAILANNTHRFYTQATEDILPNQLVNLTASIGVLSVRLANATDGTKQCDGFCSSPSTVVAGAIGEFILNDGRIQGLTGLTVGSRYYLSTVPGSITTTPPTAAGNLQQSIGIAISTTDLRFFTGPQLQH